MHTLQKPFPTKISNQHAIIFLKNTGKQQKKPRSSVHFIQADKRTASSDFHSFHIEHTHFGPRSEEGQPSRQDKRELSDLILREPTSERGQSISRISDFFLEF
jgi:hypothetical protein